MTKEQYNKKMHAMAAGFSEGTALMARAIAVEEFADYDGKSEDEKACDFLVSMAVHSLRRFYATQKTDISQEDFVTVITGRIQESLSKALIFGDIKGRA